MKILGIETSCDETAVAIVDSDKNILAHNIYSQIDEHSPYGGVVPEIAARSHMVKLHKLVEKTLKDAKITDFNELDAIAVTAGPGLIGGLITGIMVAKAIASAAKLPIIAVNHLEGHALTPRLTNNVEFPFLLLLVSGGHCQILSVDGVGKYKKLGGTIDDALGEAYDKVAKMLGLGYPGGPIVEKCALKGNRGKYIFPKPLKGKNNCDFSFSGLKTAVKRQVDAIENITEQDKYDICASFEQTVAEVLEDRLKKAFSYYEQHNNNAKRFVISGGVAANKFLRGKLIELTTKYDYQFYAPDLKLCTDNGAMIAWAGVERAKQENIINNKIDDLSFAPRARWPL